MLNDIFNALMGGASQGTTQQPAGTQPQEGGDLLSGLLGSLMGGQTSGPAMSTDSQATNQPSGDMVSGLLGSLLGGQTSGSEPMGGNQSTNQPQAGGDLVSGLLGSLLGGQTGGTGMTTGSQAGSNPLMNLVSSGQNPVLNSLIAPVVEQIAQKLGISPAIAMTVVTFAVHYLLSNHGNTLARGEDLSDVLQQHTDQRFLSSSGISKELANQTGLKPKVAANALSEVFNLLGAPSASN